MIVRIVKMTFRPEKTGEFLELFNSTKHLIRQFQGCSRLELLRDINEPAIFFTYSFWDDPSDLETYRNSDLFNTVWSRTKVLFSEKAEAWSLEQNIILD